MNHIKEYLEKQWKWLLALDIDETISNTILAWVIKMQDIFGNPEWLSPEKIVEKYKHSSNIPYWQDDEHIAWQSEKIICNEFQKDLPLIHLSQEIVNEINKVKKIGLYITARPESVIEWTKEWINNNNFPNVPILARPNNIHHKEWNQWKAKILEDLFPYIDSIVDDNPKLSYHLSNEYKWTLYLFGHEDNHHNKIHTIPCKDWNEVKLKIK